MKFLQTVWFCTVFVFVVNFANCAILSRQNNEIFTADNATITNIQVYKIVARGIGRMALTLNYILSRYTKDDVNIIFSPLNIVQTLTTVMLGTAGQTESEIANILGLAVGRRLDDKIQMIHKILGSFLNDVLLKNPGVDIGTNLNMAGGIFIQTGYQVKQSYIDNAKSIYNNDVFNVDFSNGGLEAVSTINKWITEKTDGKIKEIIEAPVDPLTKTIVAGALYFNGDWEYPFIKEATKWQTFYTNSKGKYGTGSIQVQMMVNEAEIPFYEDKIRGFQAIGIPYKNKEVYMYIVVPRLHLSVTNLTTFFTPKDIETIVEKSQLAEVFYVIPKMQLDAKFGLRNVFNCIGVRSLFDPIKANFSNSADGIYISEILHKVNMDINEIGTIAAASTSVSMNRGGFINFRADRPFFYFIYNVKVGIMTFWGKIQKPTPWK